MADHLERIGQIMGDYRLIRWLGGGGFGNVYLAEHVRDSTQVAIKVLQIRLTNHDDFRAFINEARMFRLRHPHIIPLLDFGLSREDTPFLVMEYAPKGTLRHRYPKGKRVSLLTVVEYATQMSSALQYAHDQHLVHRDVKPENMLLRDDEVILLSDFGIATAAQSTHSFSANQGIGGTVPYMAPEQLEGKPRSASDQYALGVVIYEWLAGRCPFQGTAVEVAMQHAMKPPPSLVEQVPELPKEVEAVLFKALAKDHKERFASMWAFITALQQASAPPTFRLPASPVSDKLPSSEVSIIHTLPASPLTPEVGYETITSSSVVPEPFPQVANAVTNTITPSEMKQSVSAFTPQDHPTITSMNTHKAPPASKQGLSNRYRALLFVMILLVIGGGSFVYLSLTHKDTTVTVGSPVIHKDTTVTVGSPIITTYNAQVAKDGIMFGFDAQHTRNNPYEHILNVTNVSQLHQAWTVRTGDVVYSSPAVANGLVYVGSWDHKLYAFDAATGQQKWAAPTNGAIYSSPVVSNGVVYVDSEDNSLYAFDAATGQQKWVAPTGDVIESSPMVANGLVYIGCWNAKLYAFDTATGQQKWVVSTGHAINSSPAVANGLVYVGSDDHKLYAFSL